MGEFKPKYYAHVLENLKTKPGCWDHLRVGVFITEDTPNGAHDRLVGEYERNYSSLMDTFAWFTVDGKDYALYSKDYTCTRIMSLPDCKDIGGEEPHGHGFCPVEFYVPAYHDITFKSDPIKGSKARIYDPDEPCKETESYSSTGLLHEPFGFVAGCVWGDDTSWKIQYLDLSQASKGILKREERFGYIELPGNLKLKQAIGMDGFEWAGRLKIATESTYELKSGKKFE